MENGMEITIIGLFINFKVIWVVFGNFLNNFNPKWKKNGTFGPHCKSARVQKYAFPACSCTEIQPSRVT